MKKSLLWVLTAVLSVAFILLLGMQVVYISSAHKIRNEQFTSLVKAALVQVSKQVEMDELEMYLKEHAIELFSENIFFPLHSKEPIRIKKKSDYRANLLQPDFANDQLTTSIKTEERFCALLRENTYPWASSPSSLSRESDSSIRLQRISLMYNEYQRQLLEDLILRFLLDSNIKGVMQRVVPDDLTNYIRLALDEMGVSTPFFYYIYDKRGRLVYESQEKRAYYKDVKPTKDNSIQNYLFSSGETPTANTPYIEVIFPEKEKYVSASGYAVPVGLSALIVFTVGGFALNMLYRQHRFAENKNDFINNMTHELKTPVSSISLAGQMLRDEKIIEDSEIMGRLIHVLNSESKRLTMLIEKVLQFSLFEDRGVKLTMQEVDINEIILGVAEVFDFKAQQTGGELQLDLDAEHTIVSVDEMHFKNVLFNLLENSVKYRRSNVPLELALSTRDVGNRLEIVVKDNGIGFPKESIGKVFNKFYRVPTGNKHDVKGFGLGLAYVQRVIKEMKGSVKVDSKQGSGTRMIIELPSKR